MALAFSSGAAAATLQLRQGAKVASRPGRDVRAVAAVTRGFERRFTSQNGTLGTGTFDACTRVAAAVGAGALARVTRRPSSCARAEGVASTPASGEASEKGFLSRLRARLPKPPSKEQLAKLGTGFAFAYGFIGGLNMCVMVGVSWPLFIIKTGGSPLLFRPFSLNPKFVVFLTALYFSYGTVTTPALVVASAALAPAFNWILTTIQDRFGYPRWLALFVAFSVGFVAFSLSMVAAVALGCAVCRKPVWV
mmetsp:Transcript_13429/g.36149  ORF Transcript_13429/g.36149 Transcript_13429/m.36149 type:complete len:250 (-) Transcript_13429:67-816(-)